MNIALLVMIAGCGGTHAAATTPGGTVKSANTPLPTTSPPTATVATISGAPCAGGLWGKPLTGIGDTIPLPPQTSGGISETYPSDGAWVGHVTRLCTKGDPDAVETWEETNMSAAGWNYGQPPSNCVSCAGPIWSRANDSHLVQFEQHPAVVNGAVQWSVTVFSRG